MRFTEMKISGLTPRRATESGTVYQRNPTPVRTHYSDDLRGRHYNTPLYTRQPLLMTHWIFDLDGTLSNPELGITRCLNYALDAHGFASHPAATLTQFIGPPLEQAFIALTGSRDESLVLSLVAKYRERYSDVGYAENQLYDGIPEQLAAIKNTGIAMGVCTSKRVDFAERILEHFGIREHFGYVSGGDVGIRKGQQLAALLSSKSIPQSALMIGDRYADVVAAKENSLQSLGVLWGFGSREELANAGANRIITVVTELGGLAHKLR